MATFAAVAASSRAILGLLEAAAPSEPDFATATFSLYESADMQGPVPERLTVSLYLYHLHVNTARRNTSPRVDPVGRKLKPPLPLDLHYLLTAWSKDPVMQQRLLGWCVRVLHDTPTVPAGVLNQHGAEDVFRPDETVEVIWENLSQQDLLNVWEVARANQQPSATYVARIVQIDSDVEVVEAPLAQSSDFGYGTVLVK